MINLGTKTKRKFKNEKVKITYKKKKKKKKKKKQKKTSKQTNKANINFKINVKINVKAMASGKHQSSSVSNLLVSVNY